MDVQTGDDLIALISTIEGKRTSAGCTESISVPSTLAADQYARYHELTIDSRFDHPLEHFVLADERIALTVTHSADPDELLEQPDDGQLKECLFRPIISTKEQWKLSAASLSLLQEACKPCKEKDVEDLKAEVCGAEAAELKRLKVELPLLRSDEVADCRKLERRVKAFRQDKLSDHRLPLHPVDVEKGEGVEFPKSARLQDERLMEGVERETLEVKKDTLGFLMKCLRAEWTDKDQQNYIESVSTYDGVS